MMRIVIGFALGLTFSAMAQDTGTGSVIMGNPLAVTGHLLSGTDPNGNAIIIRVDRDGYVICSSQKKQ